MKSFGNLNLNIAARKEQFLMKYPKIIYWA